MQIWEVFEWLLWEGVLSLSHAYSGQALDTVLYIAEWRNSHL